MKTDPPFIPFGHMLQDFYVARVRDLAQMREKQREEIQTAADAEKLILDVRRRASRCFGTLPKKTPLRARTTGILQRSGYRIEKVIFESRPSFHVTANLYIPDGLDAPAPGIIGSCGHSNNGKAADTYQFFCQGLVRKGFVVLMYDPIGQGERKQLSDLPGSEMARGPCPEHNMLGNSMQLCGDFLGTWRAWDGIRALDYLLTRPEVDPTHLGLTGNSGGGTLSSYLNLLDERYTMVAPSCFVTRYARNIENELPQDTEQNPPGFLGAGLEMADFFIARAPRPTLILGQKMDFFDHRGVTETYDEIRRIYRLVGKAENIKCFIGPDRHGYFKDNREAMYSFFCRVAGIKAVAEEPDDLTAEKESDLQCTASGLVVTESPRNKRVFQFTGDYALELKRKRSRLQTPELVRTVRRMLAIPAERNVPYTRILRPDYREEQSLNLNRYAIEVEPGITAVMMRPAEGQLLFLEDSGSVRLYAPHIGARSDFANGLVEYSTDQENPLYIVESRGLGESQPLIYNIPHDENASYGADFFYACCGSLTGTPLLGGGVRDILAAIRLLRAKGRTEIHLEGCGRGAVRAAFAALLAGDAVTSVTLTHALLSYQELTQTPFYLWPFSVMLPGILHKFDLPDIYRTLGKKLTLRNPWTALVTPWNEDEARSHARKLGIPAKALEFTLNT